MISLSCILRESDEYGKNKTACILSHRTHHTAEEQHGQNRIHTHSPDSHRTLR